MVVRSTICNFSGKKIYPGHGSLFAKNEGKSVLFSSSKCRRLYHKKIKPMKISWTFIYRKIKKKQISI